MSDLTIEEQFGSCPFTTVQDLISGKWATLILHYLEDRTVRFNELHRMMPKMTHATLSVQLKKLEEKGLVKRKQYESIPPCGRVFPDGNRSKIPSGYGSSSEMGRRIYRLYES